jgi:lipoprotein-anchoring transpeptidase ErfK/SrfK
MRHHKSDAIAAQELHGLAMPSEAIQARFGTRDAGGMKMRRGTVPMRALAMLACAMATVSTAAAQGEGACGQIRLACQGAGFAPGAALEGIGIQVHCIMPIMQARPQPPSARRPLPVINPQLVADCRASNPGFGQPRAPQTDALAPPASPPGLAYPNRSSPPAYPGTTAPSTSAPAPGGPDQPGAVSGLPPEEQPETGPANLPPQFRRTTISYASKEPAGTIIIDTPHTYLYLVLGNGKAMRYGIGVGREGFTWAGTEHVSRMAEWPDWNPPPEMIERQPYLPRFMAGGESNPLGARALYLGQTLYRIHGTNQPSTIGTFVSSGCIRLTNEDITDLYGRVHVGTRVVVLPGTPPKTAQTSTTATTVESTPLAPPPVRTR